MQKLSVAKDPRSGACLAKNQSKQTSANMRLLYRKKHIPQNTVSHQGTGEKQSWHPLKKTTTKWS